MKSNIRLASLVAFALSAVILSQPIGARAQSATLVTLHPFTGGLDGADPVGSMVLGSDGNFYGTTSAGGGAGKIGTVFKMTASGTLTPLYAFTGGADGSFPDGGLLEASDGEFYGTTNQGITDALGGTIFRITSAGTLTTLYKFPGGAGGQAPYGTMVEGADGKIYGTVFGGGGGGGGGSFGAGVVFVIDPTASVPITPQFLHAFTGGADGGNPYAGVVEGVSGTFYGTTYGGGIVNSMFPNGSGTIYKITSTGTLTTLHTFMGGTDGSNPRGGLVLGSDGNLYGTTTVGDPASLTPNGGIVFKITPSGTFTTLHSLTLTEGSVPIPTLIEGTDGNFYGTAETGGTSNGTIFKVTPTGTVTVLHTFQGGDDGRQPQAGLVQGTDGSFYGSTTFGGSNADDGQVFRLDVSATAQLQNISTRLQVLTADNVLIGGFIVTGTEPKTVVLRGIGPSLPVAGPLVNPVLELHDINGVIAANDNWKINDATGQSQEAEVEATGVAPTNDLESVIIATLPANSASYTVILSGAGGGTGIGLVEAYDIGLAADSELANISTRGFVDTGDNVMIGGFIAGPNTRGDTTVLVRGIGPSLPISGALKDPVLELHDANGMTIATNDNWKVSSDGGSQEAEIEATTIPPTNDLESAILSTVAPGAYTAIVRGANNTTGVGLVEVYDLH